MKRITSSLLALLLALSMLIGMVPAAYAAQADTIESINSTETVDSSEMEDVLDDAEEVAAQVAGESVARIGNTEFASLDDAIASAQNMQSATTIELLANTEITNDTLSLDGLTIKSSGTEKFEIKGLKAIAGTGITLENVYLNLTGTLEIGGTNTILNNVYIRAKDLGYWDIADGQYTSAFGYDEVYAVAKQKCSFMTKVTGTNVTMTDCTIDGTSNDTTDAFFPNMILAPVSGTNVTMTRCTFNEGYAACYYSMPRGTWTLDGCKFTKIFSYNIQAGDTPANIVVKDCELAGWTSFGSDMASVSFENCSFAKSSRYATVVAYKDATFTNCTFTENYKGNLYVEPNTTVELNGCKVVDSDGNVSTTVALKDIADTQSETTNLVAIDATKDENGGYTGGTFVGNEETIKGKLASGCEYNPSTGTVASGSTELTAYVTVNNGTDKYETLDAAIAAAEPVSRKITYTIYGKIEVSSTGSAWIQVLKDGLKNVTTVAFVGATADAEISLTNPTSVLADQNYDINVTFTELTLSHPNGQWIDDQAHATEYFATVLRNTNASGNTVTYTNCTFPDGACNNLYGKTVFDNCQFTNTTKGKYNLWNNGGKSTTVKNCTFTGARGIKTYNEGKLETPPTVKIENTTFNGLTDNKAAVVASKATDITFTNVTTENCTNGLLQKDIEGSTGNEKVTVIPDGTGVSGTFNVNAEKGVDPADDEFNLTAGTFKEEVSTDYLADGFSLESNEDGNYDVKRIPVAAINGTPYNGTLAETIKAAAEGDTITLLKNVTLSSALTISKAFTLDLSGFTLDSTAYRTIQLNFGADLTVQDSGGTGKIANSYNGSTDPSTVYLNAKDTVFTLVSGTIESDPYKTSLQSVAINSEKNKACTVNIQGGSVVVPAAAKKGRAIVASTNSMTLNIKGGTITGGLHGIDAYSGSTVNITGGKVTATDVDTGVIKEAYGMRIIGTANVTINGGEIQGIKMDDDGYNLNVPNVTLVSGKVNGSFYSITKGTIAFTVDPTATITFENDTVKNFLPSTVELVQNTDGTYGVKKGSYVAEINGKQYASLSDAIAAAKDGAEIRLLSDVTENGMDIEKSFTLDFNTHTLTVEDPMVGSTGTKTNAIRFLKNGDTTNTVVLKNGSIKSSKARILIQNYANLTVDNMVLDLSEQPLYGYVLSNNNGVTVINNSTISAPTAAGSLAFDACAFSTYGDVSVTLRGNSVINGDVGFSRDGNGTQNASLTLESGKINGNLVDFGKGETVTVTKSNDVTLDAPTGYKWVDGTLTKITYVAEVNGKTYDSLQAAIDAAPRKGTVKLLANTRENVTIDKMMTLDLNGHTLNGGTEKGKPALTITERTVTIKDSSAAQTGTIMREDTAENSGVSSHYVIDVQGGGWLTFESGTVKNGSGAGGTKGASLVRVGDDSVSKFPGLNIKGGTFTQDNFIVIKVDRGDLFLNGGTLNSKNSYAIENWHRATIKGGTVNGNVSSWTYSAGSNSTLEINAGTVNGDVESVSYDGTEGKLAKVKINGGTVNGTLRTSIYNDSTTDPAKATIEVTAGTFSRDPSEYLVEGSTVTNNSDGTFGVEKAYLAQVGETSYYTMDEAFKAQTASREPIFLLRDYTTGSPFNSGTINRTVDLNGHTWTCTGTDANSAAFEINNPNVTLTVKNGKIVSSQLVGLIPSAMGGTIKYDNSGLVFEGVEMSTTATSGIETNGNNTNDSVTLRNSTLNVPNGFGIYFPSSGTLTIENSTINAKTMGVQVCAGSLKISGDKTAITVTGDAVPKTENDGAIQDGAAISIVNRKGYKGLVDVTITEGTFKANGTNAAVKAYGWENNTATDFAESSKVSISGGTFSAIPENMNDLCKDGFVPEPNANGTYTVKEAVYVAAIGTVQYTSLQAAFDAAENGAEITLLSNIELTVKDCEADGLHPQMTLSGEKSITLNMAGYKIGYDAASMEKELVSTPAIFTIESGVSLTITGDGTIDSELGNNNSYGINVNGGALTIESGTFYGALTAVQVQTGSLTVNGGMFDLATTCKAQVPQYAKYIVNCIDANFKDGSAKITLNGGSYGYDFSNNPEGEGTSYLPAGKGVNYNDDGSFTVDDGVAQLADASGKNIQVYKTLADAIAAAQTGYTVKLLANTALTASVSVDKQITLDLDGKTIETAGHAIFVNGNLTVNGNGTINNAVEAIKDNYRTIFAVKANAELTITNGTFTTVASQIIRAEGTVTVNGGTFTNTAAEVSSVLDSSSMIFAIGTKANLVINEAKIEATAESTNTGIFGVYGANGAHITLNAGTDIHTSFAAVGMNYTTSTPAVVVTVNGGKYKAECNKLDAAKYSKFNAVFYLPGNCQLTVSGGEFTTGNDKMHVFSIPYAEVGMNLTIKGGTFTTSNDVFYSESHKPGTERIANAITVSGGTFNGKLATFGENNTFANFISGGQFSEKVPDEYCAVGYEPTEKDTSTGMYTVKQVDGNVYYMKDGKKVYGYLMTLLNDSEFTGTIYLIKDIKITSRAVFVDSSVTVDLNGKNLEFTGKLLSFGKVIDSTDGEGLLTVGDMTGSQMPSNNGYLPVKDGTGYRLYQYTMEHYYGGVFGTEASKRFIFQITFTNTDAWRKLSTDDNSVVLSYEGAWNGNTKLFRFTDSTLDGMGKASNIGNTGYFTMTISGLDKLGSGVKFNMTPALTCAFFTQKLSTVNYTIGG